MKPSRQRRPGRPGRRPRQSSARGELPVLTQYYGLLVWCFERAEGFPKVLRPSLTQRFLTLLLEGLETLLELRYTREREPLFRTTNLTLEKLRFLSRALKDRRAFSLTQYEHFNRELNGVGRQLGGWRKACELRQSAGDRRQAPAGGGRATGRGDPAAADGRAGGTP